MHGPRPAASPPTGTSWRCWSAAFTFDFAAPASAPKCTADSVVPRHDDGRHRAGRRRLGTPTARPPRAAPCPRPVAATRCPSWRSGRSRSRCSASPGCSACRGPAASTDPPTPQQEGPRDQVAGASCVCGRRQSASPRPAWRRRTTGRRRSRCPASRATEIGPGRRGDLVAVDQRREALGGGDRVEERRVGRRHLGVREVVDAGDPRSRARARSRPRRPRPRAGRTARRALNGTEPPRYWWAMPTFASIGGSLGAEDVAAAEDDARSPAPSR